MPAPRADRTEIQKTLDRLLTAVEDALDVVWDTGQGHEAFRKALLALDREATGGKLPGLVSWIPCENNPPDARIVVLVKDEEYGGHLFRWHTVGDVPYEHLLKHQGLRAVAYLPLRVEDALPQSQQEPEPPRYACTLCDWEGYNPDTTCPECLRAREPRRVGHPEACRCPLCSPYMADEEGR